MTPLLFQHIFPCLDHEQQRSPALLLLVSAAHLHNSRLVFAC